MISSCRAWERLYLGELGELGLLFVGDTSSGDAGDFDDIFSALGIYLWVKNVVEFV